MYAHLWKPFFVEESLKMNKKLIIWDFDGVIADTEVMWLQTRMELLNQEFNVGWNLEKTNHFLGGMSDKTKTEVLHKLGISTTKEFWQKAMDIDMQKTTKGLTLTKNITEIFKMNKFVQCIATGGVKEKTALKIKMVGIEKFFPAKDIFTADMVAHGKPEPDLFLLAAKNMGYDPKDCIVIEDSLAGLTAAVKAGMYAIAFTEYLKFSKEYFWEQLKKLHIEHAFDNMQDLKKFLENI